MTFKDVAAAIALIALPILIVLILTHVDYDGKIGDLRCMGKNDNPFDTTEPKCVRIINIKQGYVQFERWYHPNGSINGSTVSISSTTEHTFYRMYHKI